MAGKRPTDEDRVEAVRRLLSGLRRDEDVFELAASVYELHPKYNTFPGEVFMDLAADVLEYVAASRDDPISYEGLYAEFLPECRLKSLCDHRGSISACYGASASAAPIPGAIRGRVVVLLCWRPVAMLPGGFRGDDQLQEKRELKLVSDMYV